MGMEEVNGQKPIKGSPYPRGYYRCSSSKGCPARKQVERSRLDPTMLLIIYSDNHNHPLPASKHLLRQHQQDATKSDQEDSTSASASASAGEFVADDVVEDSLIDDPNFHWLTEAASRISYPRRPIYAGGDCASVAVSAFSMGEEDESLFGNLGELPERAVVFRLGNPVKTVETSRQCSMNSVPCVGHAGQVGRSN